MGHHQVLFPTDISYGSQSGWGFDHGIVQLRSGANEYVSHHSDSTHYFDVAYGIKTPAQMATVKQFYHARNGLSNSFLYQDPMDMDTSSTPYLTDGGPGTVATSDVIQVDGAAGGETQFQLVKRYADAGGEYVRTIRHPVDGTLVIEVEPISTGTPVAIVETTDWTIDLETGIVTLVSALTANDIVRAGFQFYERVRFAPEADKGLSVTVDSFGSAGMSASVPLVAEIQSTSHIDDFDYGWGTTSTDTTLSWSPSVHGRTLLHAPTAASTITMPNAADYALGGPYLLYRNNQGTYTTTFKDSAGTTLFSVAGSSGAIVGIVDNGGTNAWEGFVGT